MFYTILLFLDLNYSISKPENRPPLNKNVQPYLTYCTQYIFSVCSCSFFCKRSITIKLNFIHVLIQVSKNPFANEGLEEYNMGPSPLWFKNEK